MIIPDETPTVGAVVGCVTVKTKSDESKNNVKYMVQYQSY